MVYPASKQKTMVTYWLHILALAAQSAVEYRSSFTFYVMQQAFNPGQP